MTKTCGWRCRITHPAPGMPDFLIQEMFHDGHRVSREGLGLHLTQNLVKIMNGTVQYHRGAERSSFRILIDFPLDHQINCWYISTVLHTQQHWLQFTHRNGMFITKCLYDTHFLFTAQIGKMGYWLLEIRECWRILIAISEYKSSGRPPQICVLCIINLLLFWSHVQPFFLFFFFFGSMSIE